MVVKKQKKQVKSKTNRLTITLPSDVYGELERRALEQDVSIAWVIRKAVNHYIDADIPLLSSYSEGN